MIIKNLSAEWLKLKHSHIWLVLIALPIISIFFGSINFYFNQSVLTNEWHSLWTQVSLFYGEFFLPILIAICCSYISRLEHLNKNWTLAMTAPTPIGYIFIAKLTVVSSLILFVQLFFLFLYFIVGKCFGFTSPLPFEVFGWVCRGFMASLSIISLQLFLSIKIKSFATPIGIGLCFVFIGIGLYIMKVGMLFPHSLLTIGMGVISQQSLTTINNLIFYVMNVGFIIFFSFLAIEKLKRLDI